MNFAVLLFGLLQVRPRLPRVPAFLKLRLGFLKGCHTIGARHRTVGVPRNGQGARHWRAVAAAFRSPRRPFLA
jgi:hypothetical protein